jgi:hypothetical protein
MWLHVEKSDWQHTTVTYCLSKSNLHTQALTQAGVHCEAINKLPTQTVKLTVMATPLTTPSSLEDPRFSPIPPFSTLQENAFFPFQPESTPALYPLQLEQPDMVLPTPTQLNGWDSETTTCVKRSLPDPEVPSAPMPKRPKDDGTLNTPEGAREAPTMSAGKYLPWITVPEFLSVSVVG